MPEELVAEKPATKKKVTTPKRKVGRPKGSVGKRRGRPLGSTKKKSGLQVVIKLGGRELSPKEFEALAEQVDAARKVLR